MSKTVIISEENKCNTIKEKKSYLKLIVFDAILIVAHISFFALAGDSSELSWIPGILTELILCLIYMIIYGIVSYCVYRRVLYPHLITCVLILISIYIITAPYFSVDNAILSSVLLCCFLLCSFVVSLLTKLIFKLRECRRKK